MSRSISTVLQFHAPLLLHVNSTCFHGDGITTILDTGPDSSERTNSILSLFARNVEIPASFFNMLAIWLTSLLLRPWLTNSFPNVSPDATTTTVLHSDGSDCIEIRPPRWVVTTAIATNDKIIANAITNWDKNVGFRICFTFCMAPIIIVLWK